MNKNEFMEYLRENFNIAPEAYRLINNILEYVQALPLDENGKYLTLCNLLDNTIGLSDAEIRKISL